jgi:hypothetical protein
MAKGITQPQAVEMRHFTGFPGVYGPGVVLRLDALGLTEKQASERIAAGNLPLEIVELDKPAKGGEK